MLLCMEPAYTGIYTYCHLLSLHAALPICGVEADSLGPSALIGAVLKAQVDLLWFGGIGTYVKGASETNGQVGDRANDLHRVDGRDLRARVVGEGANLGVTQAGRIEYAASRGRIHTDLIEDRRSGVWGKSV